MFNGFVASEINSKLTEDINVEKMKNTGKRQAVRYSVQCTLYIEKS
jgi:hypothetical protein